MLSGIIVNTNVCVAVDGDAYPVVAKTLNEPLVVPVGVPVMIPTGLIDNPAGRFVDEYA
jgi:hypothetical protein